MSDCVFCKIINGDLPGYKVSETKDTLSILDIAPAAKGHVLVLSKVHARNIHELNKEILADIINEVKLISERLVKKMGITDYNVIVNNGTSAGQVVPHVHFHIVPRLADDGVVRFTSGEKLDTSYYEELQKILKDDL